ncbi:sulfatase-like hydrolase/transferase [candidate division KSB3 bacterium]|uniref:Sulfatase-like hydrolase/transferase n=1 Tax=candidate division KSB3 bacterium TaxID=2044937 RepID=A0A9D5Q699_9BACT|nr:sulfatase-like hydrolase/transferase [candidate division KSB3 bacterium]MBD3325047.1 sulfatase-like hydrolase/transferase [candidate division KSB3 bacterium]
MNLKNSRVTNLFLVVLVLVSVVVYAVLTVCRPESAGLQGRYYANTEWGGEPEAVALDTSLSTQTLEEIRAQLPENAFSVEWSGFLHIPETGVYSFSLNSDDGSWLFLDENLVVDNGGPHGVQEAEGKIHLLEGLHQIRVRYFQVGGILALQVGWAREPFARIPLTSDYLFPPDTSPTQFWLYRIGQSALPVIIILWVLTLLVGGIRVVLDLQKSKQTHFTRHIRGFPMVRALLAGIVDRLCLQPLSFVAAYLKNPQTWLWIGVGAYAVIIFLTLSYARAASQYLTQLYGNEIFSRITVSTLSVSGIGFVVYILFSRNRLVSRLLYFAGIAAIYAYILSPEVREAVHGVTQLIGYTGEFFASLDLYPIVPAEKIHFLEYGLLGLLACKALSAHIKDKTAYLLAIGIVYLVGMTDEGIQWALPNRVGEYRDIWLNFVSGGLAILAVLLVIRPRVLARRVQWPSLRPLCYLLAVAVVYTGVFFQVVHGFGSHIFMPDTGTEFVSAFSEYRLLQIDKRLLQRFEGKLADDTPPKTLSLFTYEARRHHFLRDRHYQQERFFRSYCEQEILKTYFRSYIRTKGVSLLEYEPADFAVRPDPDAHVFYASPAQELAITAFSQRAMWSVISLVASFLCIAATFFPASAKTLIRRKHQGIPLRRMRWGERYVLRPVFIAVFLIALGVIGYSAQASPDRPYTNLVILTVDSCQPDYWGAYGYDKNTTPFFDALASEGVLFSNAIVPTAWTIPSLASMLTGVSPNVHGIDARGKLMDPRIPTLFEALEQHGYAIGDTSYTLTEPSINSVFKKSDISPEVALSEGRSEESYLLSWMEEHQDQPFFGWVHFHTAHLPYRATPPYNKLFLDGIDPDVLNDEEIEFVRSQLIIRKGEVEFDPARQREAIHALYAQTLRQQDAKIGKVLMKLDELGLRENTLIIITADHGDELLEHGFIGHASTSWAATLYDDLIQVPLLVYSPHHLPAGKRIAAQVRMIDIMPTVLDVLNLPFDAKIQGKSFLPLIRGTGEFDVTAFAETTPCGYSCPKRLESNRLRAVRTNEWKLIAAYDHETDETSYELYHLEEDPGETENVIEDYPAVAAQFKETMQRWMDAPEQFAYQPEETEEQHYLDVDVEVRPIILFPKVGTVLTPETYNRRVLVKWIGQEDAEYIIEYDIGTGGYKMTGELEVVGTEQWFGPFPEDIWQSLPLYNPWKFRVIPKEYPQYPSDWITFEMHYTPPD